MRFCLLQVLKKKHPKLSPKAVPKNGSSFRPAIHNLKMAAAKTDSISDLVFGAVFFIFCVCRAFKIF